MSEQPIELSVLNIGLISRTLLQCVTPNSNKVFSKLLFYFMK